jgi:SCP-2 sterol transfer family
VPSARAGTARAADPIGGFFASLAEPGQLATFAGQSASIGFDVTGGPRPEHWRLAVTRGDVSVSRDGSRADAAIQVSRPVLEEIVTGRLNAQAALLRGLLTCSGSMAALIMFQRCLPGPPGSTGRVRPISGATVMQQRRPK